MTSGKFPHFCTPSCRCHNHATSPIPSTFWVPRSPFHSKRHLCFAPRELNRTPPMDDEPFQAPMSGSESESNSRPSHIRLQMQKQVSRGQILFSVSPACASSSSNELPSVQVQVHFSTMNFPITGRHIKLRKTRPGQNGTFVLKSTGGFAQPDVSPCITTKWL